MKEALSIKNRLISALLVLVMMFTSLIGTTFAWFTDEVTSSGNKIQSGNLQVDLSHLYKGEWLSLKENKDHKILNYDKWEPGYTLVDSLKVDNLGSLALKYRLSVEIEPGSAKDGKNGEKLSDVIEVYITYGDTAGDSYSAIKAESSGWTYKGTLTEVLSRPQDFITGQLLPTGGVVPTGAPAHTEVRTQVVKIALHMKESAGNEYQDLSVGDIYVSLLASQLDYENDSFGGGYDSGAEWPESPIGKNSIKAPIGALVDGKLAASMFMQSDDAKTSATFPEGVKADEGATEFVLNFDELAAGQANITLDENEEAIYLNVHVDGVAEDNEIPIAVYRKEVLPKGLNIGNYRLYHVEDGVTVQMTLRQNGATPVHNDFDYDPVTGDAIFYLKSFSEVALVAEPPKWEGNRDYSWYTNAVAPVAAEGEADYVIANADQLAAFGAIVGGMAKDENGNFLITYTDSDGDVHHNDTFSGKTVKLIADINLGDKESENNPDIIFYPIGYWNSDETYEKTNNAISSGFYTFEGTFDGNGNTISNFYQNTWEMKGDHNWYDATLQYYRDGMGLFGKVYGGTVKNLTVKNFSSDGEITTTGTIAAYAEGATFENIAIFNCNPRVYNIGNGGIVGCVGWYAKEADLKTTFTNITVDNSNKISALWGSYDVACGGIVGQYYPTSGQTSVGTPKNGGVEFKNCHVAAQMDVYNDVCANYQYYAYRYTGMLIGSVRENETINGHVYPKMDGITASGCTVHFGDWNDYYYCELVANSLASYTHDHQFSRLEQVASVDVANKTVTDLKGNTTAIPTSGRVNYVVVNGNHATENATCYHFVDGKVHDHNDYNGDGVEDKETVNGKEEYVENNRHIYLEFNNLVTGYGWGVTSRGFSNLNGVTNLDIAQGDQEASVEKFEDAGYTPKDYRHGETITIGDLFKAKDGVTINKDSVYVSVSPITEGDKVSATFTLNTEDWTKSTITFAADSTGTAKVTITDYIFCTPTTIYLNEEDAVAKFTANSVGVQNAYSQITLGTLFGVKGGATIGNVTATVTDPNGNEKTVTGTSSDWETKTIDLVKEGTWTVSIVDDDKYCAATETTFTVDKVDKFTKKFDKDFLYRVGSADNSPVSLGTMFGENETAVGIPSVNITITNVAGNAGGTFTSNATWTSGKIQFSGTGVVTVTISADGANPVELNLEVVDATNLIEATGTTTGGNFVLLQDVETNNYVNYWNCTLYGNGFTYSLKNAPTAYNSKQGKGIIIVKNAVLDNLVIIGDVYNQYGAFTNNDYYNTVIDVTTGGQTIIQNCYISGCAAPVRARDSVTIVDSTLYGGAVGNLIIEAGTVTLEDVITANFDDGRSIVGMGIVIHSDATDSAKLVLNGTLTQYNFISESKVPTDTYAKNLHTAMFDLSMSNYHFGTSPNRYVNAGVVSLTANFNGEDITDNANTGYSGSSVSLSGVNGYVYTQLKTSGSVNNNCPEYKPTMQGAVPPSYSFDYTNKNYVAKTDGSNDYCYEENGKVNISMDEGDTFNWDTSILTLGKGITNYTVTMNGTDYTGKSIAFNTADDYEVIYSYTDDNNYKLDANGNIITYSVTYTKIVDIVVAVVKATTKHAEFTFGSDNIGSTTVTVDNSTYVMPNVGATSSTIGSTTVSGQTIYYPIVEIIMSDGNTSHTSGWYAYFPVFSGAVTITDYANKGTGDALTPYNASTTTMPSGLSVVGDAKTLFKYQSGSNAGETPVVKNNILVYSSAKIEANRDEYSTVVQYSYTDNAGSTYYYYIGYHAPAQTYSNGCVTPDTLVTLADGTQKEIQHVTYEDQLLVWDFVKGEYTAMPAIVVRNHGYSDYRVITLYFNDGTTIDVIAEHGFFDVDLNEFVMIGEENVDDYIGHSFVKADGEFTTVTLDSYSVREEYTAAYSILTAIHYNCVLGDMFTLTPNVIGGNYFMPFDVGEDMKFDADKMQADIEKYGLFTYEEFADLVTEEQFYALNAPYVKVAVGKGIITMDDLYKIIEELIPKAE